MNRALPRVLVVAHNPFNWEQNNSRTMSSLFQSWPPDGLAQVYVPFMTPIPPSGDVCRAFWPVTPAGILRDVFEARDRGFTFAGVGPHQANAPSSLTTLAGLKGLARSRFIMRLADPVRELIYAAPSAVTPRLLAWSRAHRPDLVYSMLGSIHCMRIAAKLASELGVPIVPHFTDDWPATLYEDAFFSKSLRQKLDFWLHRVLELSPVRLAISAAMATEYEKRYGGRFIPAANPADPDLYDPSPRNRLEQEPFHLVYMGNLRLRRWRSLLAIGDALRVLKDEGIHATLDIYSPERDREEFAARLERAPVTLRGFVHPDEIPRVLSDADVVCLVESFDEDVARYTRLSFSTKIAECSMAGRAILALGPSSQSSLQAVADSGCGIHVAQSNPDILVNSLRALLTDSDRLRKMGSTARAIGEQDYSRAAVASRFREALAAATVHGDKQDESFTSED